MKRMENLNIQFPYEHEGINRMVLIDHVFHLWHQRDPEAALEWNRQSDFPQQQRERREARTKVSFCFQEGAHSAAPCSAIKD